jgi:hypothetical protein
MCKKFRDICLHGLRDYTFEVERKVFFHCAWQGQQTLTAHDAKIFNYAILEFSTIVMHK